MASITVLHPGEMGSAIGAALVERGHRVSWIPSGRSDRTAARARDAGLVERDDVAGCDVVISICPPAAAAATARSIGAFSGLYLDANATSPRSAATVAAIVSAAGATYVDGSVIGSPPRRPGTTRLYLSGESADHISGLFAGSRLDTRVLAGDPFAASALKMAYASWSKISSALLLAAGRAAEALHVADALRDELALSQYELIERMRAAEKAAGDKGWRWEGEMHEIAQTMADSGLPADFAAGAARIFAAYPRP